MRFNGLNKKKILTLFLTLSIMIPFVISQYLNPFGNNLKHRLDNLPIYKWICSQPFALDTNGYVTMHSGFFDKYMFLGNLQELFTAIIFIILGILVFFILKKIIYFLADKFELGKKEI